MRRTVPVDGDPLLVAAGLLAGAPAGARLLYERDGRFQLGLGTRAEVTAEAGRVRDHTGKTVPVNGNPLPAVAAALDRLPIPGWTALGWANFELAYVLAGLPVPDGTPLLHVVVPEVEVRLEPGRAEVAGPDAAAVGAVLDLLGKPVSEREFEPAGITVTTPDAHYTAAVADCVAAIRAERLEKVILSREVAVPGPVDLLGSYVHGRRHNTPARSFVVDAGGVHAVGFSPETVVEVHSGGTVRTQPLAGTRARTGDPAADAVLRHELTTDAKEIYEHAVSVRLACRELDGICTPGTVAVRDFMSVKDRGRVQHLGSEAVGELAPPADGESAAGRAWRAFGALFPSVTASGIPKTAAYQAIRAHERSHRGLYAGAVLRTDDTGAIDAALVLRTVFRSGGRTWLRAGAGIVAQSRPEREFTETCEKLTSVAAYLVRP